MPGPPTNDKGTETSFLMHPGYCISTWAEVEQKLFEICWKALQSPREQAAIVYYRTPTLDARLTLTDELLRHVLPKRERPNGGHDHPDVMAWDALDKEITELLPTRNRLAHHPSTRQYKPPDPGDHCRMVLVSQLHERD
jgi:hypothetical protein